MGVPRLLLRDGFPDGADVAGPDPPLVGRRI